MHRRIDWCVRVMHSWRLQLLTRFAGLTRCCVPLSSVRPLQPFRSLRLTLSHVVPDARVRSRTPRAMLAAKRNCRSHGRAAHAPRRPGRLSAHEPGVGAGRPGRPGQRRQRQNDHQHHRSRRRAQWTGGAHGTLQGDHGVHRTVQQDARSQTDRQRRTSSDARPPDRELGRPECSHRIRLASACCASDLALSCSCFFLIAALCVFACLVRASVQRERPSSDAAPPDDLRAGGGRRSDREANLVRTD